MSYSDDAVKAKLSALNETQDSIVSVAQWIMFHRRHADRTASLWLARLQDSSVNKRLNLIYLANEVVQQSRARGKTDFMLAFEPLIADATGIAYKHASQDIQGKIKRVVEVWRQRSIFDPRILEAIEGRIKELDAGRKGGSGRANGSGRLGGSLFGGSGGSGSVPEELDGVAKAQVAVAKAAAGIPGPKATADSEYEKMTDPDATVPTPPVHAARLSALVRTLATAQHAVEASIKARRELISGLEKLLETNRQELAQDEAHEAELQARRDDIEAKKRDVEDTIMRGLSNPSTPAVEAPGAAFPPSADSNGATNNVGGDPTAPEPESFTPPPPDVEAFTPPPAGADEEMDEPLIGDEGPRERLLSDTTGAESMQELPPNPSAEPAPAFEPPPALKAQAPPSAADQAADFLSSLIAPPAASPGTGTSNGMTRSSPSGEDGPADPRLKRRKMSHKSSAEIDDEIFGNAAMDGVDEDSVAALLGS